MNKISYIYITFSLCSILSSGCYAADSSNINITPKPVTSLHLESTTAVPSDIDLQTTIVGGGSGTTIPACSAINSTINSTRVCKGVNGLPAGGINCVDFCTVTRFYNSVNTFTNQSCPAEYNAIAVYKAGTEYRQAPPPVYPVPNYSTWQGYASTPGWSCFDSFQTTHGGGNQGDWCWSPGHSAHSTGYNDLAFCDGTPAVVRITSVWCPSPTGLATDCNAGAWVWKYSGAYQTCAPSGQYVANVTSANPYPNIPTSIVCAHIKSVWRP